VKRAAECSDELRELLIGLVDGELTAAQYDRLGAILQDDPAARQSYCCTWPSMPD